MSKNLLNRRGEILAETFLQSFKPEFLAKAESQPIPFDFLAGFKGADGTLRMFAVEVKLKPVGMKSRFPLVGSRQRLLNITKSNIPVLLLFVDTKKNEFYYAWGDSINLDNACYLKETGRIMVSTTLLNESEKAELRSVFVGSDIRELVKKRKLVAR
jgi:hypothetical protein